MNSLGTPISRRLVERVGKKLAQLHADIPYHEVKLARTGRLDDDGTINPNPVDGLPDGWIWVRQSFNSGVTYSRAAVPAHCAVRNDYANLPCLTGIDYEGYLTAFGGRVDEETINQLGALAAAMSVPQAPPVLQTQIVASALLDPGLVRPSDDGGFTLVVQGYNGGQWMQTTVDASALASPASGTVALGVVIYDPYEGAASLIGVSELPYADTTYGLGASAFADALLLPGAFPLAGVAVAYGTTGITKTTLAAFGASIIDLRLWLEPYNTGGYWIVDDAAAIPAAVSGVIPYGVRVTSGGALTVNGTLCVAG